MCREREFARSPPDVLGMSLFVYCHIIRPDDSGRMVIGHWLSFKARHCGLGKDLFRASVDRKHFACVITIQTDFCPKVILVACAGNGDIAADQEPVIGLDLVRADSVTVVLNYA